MLTKEQEKWLEHLNNSDKIEILPYNPKASIVFEEVKKEIHSFLPEVQVLHCGSTALEILGQSEIDIYVPVLEKDFDKYLEKMKERFGEPASFYTLERARFVRRDNRMKITVFLMNQELEKWKDHMRFENYLKENKEALQKYIKIKEESNGLSTREYYRKKLEFINEILNKINL